MVTKTRISKVIVKILLATVISLILVIILYLSSFLFQIKVIETNVQEKDISLLPKLKNRYIFSDIENEIRDSFLNNHLIEKVEITKKYPYTINISVLYRSPVATITGKNGDFYIDKEGMILKEAEDQKYAIIYATQSELVKGTVVSNNTILYTLQFMEKSKSKGIEIKEVIPLEKGIVQIVLREGTVVVLDNNVNINEVISSLQMILRRFTIEGKLVSKIDYRFDKPIVTY